MAFDAPVTTFACDLDADLVRRAYMAASTEETRPYLCGVRIEPLAAGGVLLVAIDGHMLLAFHDASGTASGNVTLSLTKETLRKCVDSSKGKPRLIAAVARVKVECPQRGAIEAQELASQPVAISEHWFPNWRACLPNFADLKETVCAAVDAGRLATLGKALSGQRGGAPVRLFGDGAGSAYWVEGSGLVEGFGVIMPLRGDAVPLRARPWLA